jgi:hypothetical protein
MATLTRVLTITAASLIGAAFFPAVFLGQQLGQIQSITQSADEVWMCPMDPDVRGHDPGTCPRCGMKLVNGIPEPVEYAMDLKVSPGAPKPLQTTTLDFTVRDPWKMNPVKNFQLVHEKLFHMFVVSQDLKFFVHEHPVQQEDGTFRYKLAFPQSGLYRILGDFYPDGSTPQLIAKSVIVPGAASNGASNAAPKEVPKLTKDYATKKDANLEVELVTDPPQPIAHTKTMMFFRLKASDGTPTLGLEKLLGAWGHMLAASDDLIDMIHTHPFLADGGPQIQFNMIFPRAKNFRVWVQFQRNGVVNTVHFDVPVEDLK